MRRFIFVFIVCVWQCSLLQAQNVGISNVLFTPQSPLHIYKTVDGNMLQISSSTMANSGFQIDMVGGVNFNLINRQSGYLGFYTSNTERMRILSGGNVGIGTTAPTAQLHTTGTVRLQNYPSGMFGAIVRTDIAGNLSITNFTGNTNDVLLGNNTFGPAITSATAWQLLGNSGTNPATNFLGTIDAQDLVFRTNNLQRMRISSTGFAGINTNPNTAYQLFVNGSAGTTGIYSSITVSAANQHAISGYSTGSVAGTGYGVGASSNAVQGYTFWGYAYRFGVAGYRYDDSQGPSAGVFGAVSTANPPAAWGALGFQDASLGEWGGYFTGRGYFSNNLGVATTAPSERLHVEGNVRFSGALMPNNNPGTNGQVLVSHGAGVPPTWDNLSQHTFGTNNQGVNGTTDITLNSATWTNMTGMSITFTPVHNLVYILFTFSAYADPGWWPMQYVDFRILRNGVSIGASNCLVEDYDDVDGLVTSFNGAMNLAVPVTAGASTTITVQWRRDGLYTGPVYCWAATFPDFCHRSLIIID